MTKAIVRLVALVALTLIGLTFAASGANAAVKVNSKAAVTVSYRVAAFEDGSARIVRRVHVGQRVVKVNVWATDEGSLLPRTCSTIVLNGTGIRHTIAATYCSNKPGRFVATRIATDEDVEGDIHYDTRQADPRTSTLPRR